MNFSEATRIALLGTERQSMPTPAGNAPLDALIARLDPARPEQLLLSAAALSGLRERAGRLPPRDLAPLSEPCPPEELPNLNDRANSLLLRLADGDHPNVLPECLGLAARAGQLPSPEDLPSLLDAGSANPELREGILPLLSRRGRWLATQNADWGWVLGEEVDDEKVWQTGDARARWSLLQRLRRANPARGRELLASTWKQASHEERTRFVALLEIGLTQDDEPFLEAALDDQRKEVRRAAAALLPGLPQSSLSLRMIQRSRSLLRFAPGESRHLLKLQKAKPACVEVTLPDECDKAMLRDGLEPKTRPGFGEKAWWLSQLLERVPLDFWTAEWRISPAEVLAASLDGEWGKELFEAWTRAAIRQKSANWAGVLFDAALRENRQDVMAGLLGAMPADEHELRLAELIAADNDPMRAFLGSLVARHKQPWSPRFSRAVLTWMRRVIRSETHDWQLRDQFKDFAPRLAPETLLEATNDWPADSTGGEFWRSGIDNFLVTVRLRAQLHDAFAH